MSFAKLRLHRPLLGALLLGTALSFTATAQAQTQATASVTYDIPAGPLAPALGQFARLSGTVLSYDPALVRNRTTPGLRGGHGAASALDTLLAGSGLRATPDQAGGFAIVAAPAPAGAATAAPSPSRPRATAASAPVEEIIVSAARTKLPASALPLTVDVIDAATLSDQVAIAGSTVDAVATLLPSFSPTRQKMTGVGETLRGRSPLFAINGIPQTSPIRDGARDAYSIDPFFIDRVETVFGSNALQGIGGTGGVINQVTVGAPKHDGFSGRVLVQGVSDDGFDDSTMGGKVAALVSNRDGAYDATVGAVRETRGVFVDAKGRRIGLDADQGDIQNSVSWSLFGRFGADLGETTRVELVANRFELEGDGEYTVKAGNRDTGLPTTSIRADLPGDAPANKSEMLSASLTDSDLHGGDLTTQLYFNRIRNTYGADISATFQDASIAPIGTLFDQSAIFSRKLGARGSYEREVPGVEGLTATVGLDSQVDRTSQAMILTNRRWVPETDFYTNSAFLQANWSLFDGLLRLAGGARREDVKLEVDDFVTLASYGNRRVTGGKLSFDKTLYNGGVVLELTEGLRFYGAYAEGFTVPDVGRVLRTINRDGVRVETYANMIPIISDNREIGVELNQGPLTASATYFWSDSKFGQLLVYNAALGFNDIRRQAMEIEGLETNVTARTPVPGLDLSAGYARLRGRTDGNNDGVLDRDLDGANISPDRLNLAANYAQERFSARLQAQFYLSRDFEGVDVRNNFEGYTLVDALIRYDLGFGNVSLAVQNLLDRQYITYSSDTGYAGDNLRYFAGRGRTLTVGWDYSF
ncbi:TonB-dependent receptor domain-containing protein [Niveispirillum sp. KHB5.9]|uniref:TonB-dependent receptor domain-containing protein n=1 Tax=Niveispirillum sp. KHB5.9 TaxID=3400269 RepID=UPI003A8C49F0